MMRSPLYSDIAGVIKLLEESAVVPLKNFYQGHIFINPVFKRLL